MPNTKSTEVLNWGSAEERTKVARDGSSECEWLVGSGYLCRTPYLLMPMLFGNNGISTCSTATWITPSRAGLSVPHPSFVPASLHPWHLVLFRGPSPPLTMT